MARFLALWVCIVVGLPAWADKLGTPSGSVILTVSGGIAAKNAGDAAQFDLEMLRELGATEFSTSTIWTDGEQRFTGVSLHVLMGALGVKDGTLRATAINDYTVEIPVADAVPGGPMIAYEMNGNTMSIRDKGPLWVIYPYDQNADYRTEVIYSRSIWQLDRIEAVE